MIVRGLKKLGERSASISERIIPDPWILVVVLTIVAIGATLAVGSTPAETMNAWYDGVWDLLTFMAQICITLIMGDAIAKSRAATKLFRRIATLPSSAFQAVYIVTLVSLLSGLISWAMGLIVGAVMARQVAFRGHQRGMKFHYPLLVAGGYTALMIWHMGITTSSGLMMTDPAAIPDTFPDYAQDGIPLNETLGSTVNLVTVAALLLIVPPVMALLHPKDDGSIKTLPNSVIDELEARLEASAEEAAPGSPGNPAVTDGGEPQQDYLADKLNNTRVWGLLIAVFPAYYVVYSLYSQGIVGLDLNTINAVFITGALLLWLHPLELVDQMEDSVRNCSGILLQFPFYAGIAGLLTYTDLGMLISQFFADVSTPLTWPILGLISTGIVNVFVPSGGGQWVAQGPILLETTQELGMPIYVAVILESFGDGLTNMIQPFWAIPALALADLRARDMLGYTFIAMVVGFIVMATTLTVFVGLVYY
jgi:short-chain fatty acids transporter